MLTEKQILEQRLLEMESLVRVVVHDNSNLRARLEGLKLNKSYMNVLAAKKTAVPPATVHPYASTSAQKEKNPTKPPKPPMKLLSLVQSTKGSSSTCSATSRRHKLKKQRPNDVPHHPKAIALSKSNCPAVLRHPVLKIAAKRRRPNIPVRIFEL